MAILRRKSSAPPTSGVVGPVRLARRDSDLAALRDGDLVLVQMPDLDTDAAHDLVDRGVRAVLNTAPSSTGRVPNQGPTILTQAGVLLIDVDAQIWDRVRGGDLLQIDENRVLRDGALIGTGRVLDADSTRSELADAESGLATRLDTLTANAADHIQREQAMLLGGAQVPRLRTDLRHRMVVVVSDGYDAKADLKSLKRFIADHDPVLIGAGAGADLLLAAGHRPDLAVGELSNLSDKVIRSAGEVVVTTASGQVDGPERLERHGKEIVTFVSTGADDDLAIVLADSSQASVIVHVGAPPTLADFLERPPSEVARMFVARLRAGAKIVDAKSAVHLSAPPLSWRPVLLLLLVGVIAVAAAVAATPVGQDWLSGWFDATTLGGASS